MRPEAARAALLAALLSAGPGLALPTTIAPVAAAPADDATQDIVGRALAQAQADRCPAALALLDPLVPRLARGAQRAAAQTVRLSCLGPAGRGAEVPGVYAELAATLPKSPYVRSMGVLVAASAGTYDVAAGRLAAIAQDDPATLAMIPADSWRAIEQRLAQDGKFAIRDRTVIALARADWQPPELPELRDTLAQDAIGALLAQRQVSEAGLLLDRITIPELLTDMATERRYEPLWPAIEARMGTAQARSADRFAAARLDAYARTPDDPHAVREAVRAFGLLGRYDDANQVGASVAVTEGMDEDAVAAVRYDAQVMQAAGKAGSAIARLQPFATLDPARTPMAVSALVALAEMLDEAGRAEEALAVSRAALVRGREALSPWGAAWLHRTELCSLTALGRAAEAKAAGDRLKAQAAQNQPAAIEGLLCARRTDEAATLAIATLGTDEGAGYLADQFQPDGAIWLGTASRLRALWTALLARPDVKSAFEKRARLLPRAYWPDRTPRPIPRAAGTAGDPSPTT